MNSTKSTAIGATLLLTSDQQDIINYIKLANEIDILIASKPNGIYSNGTTGEFYIQTEKEFDKIVNFWQINVKWLKIPFQIGVRNEPIDFLLNSLEEQKRCNLLPFRSSYPIGFQSSWKRVSGFFRNCLKRPERLDTSFTIHPIPISKTNRTVANFKERSSGRGRFKGFRSRRE